MKKYRICKKEKHNRRTSFFTDFTRNPETTGFILSNMKVHYECIPNFEKPEDLVLTVSFLGTMNVAGASACEKISDETEALPFPPNGPIDMAFYCSMAMLDHIGKVYTMVNEDCNKQWEALAKDSSDPQRPKSNFVLSEYSTQIELKEPL